MFPSIFMDMLRDMITFMMGSYVELRIYPLK